MESGCLSLIPRLCSSAGTVLLPPESPGPAAAGAQAWDWPLYTQAFSEEEVEPVVPTSDSDRRTACHPPPERDGGPGGLPEGHDAHMSLASTGPWDF